MLFILIGTFNGSAYIQEQIKSIRAQSFHQDWRLLIRDDLSSDDTLVQIESIVSQDKHIQLIPNNSVRLGPAGNYGALMHYAYEAGANYVMLADQDDVWLPNKISEQMALMEEMERENLNKPTIVHSDLIVVDEKLQKIHPSFMTYQGIYNEENNPLQVLLVQNFVTGCASLINRSLLKVILPVPGEVIMHDWWIALCAAACGHIGYLPHPTILYRQHSGNHVGAKGFLPSLNPLRKGWLKKRKKSVEHFSKTFLQASSLKQRLVERNVVVTKKIMNLVCDYENLMELSPIQRIQRVITLGIHRQDAIRQWLLYLHLLLMRRERGS